jgi:transmembrane sensor
MRFYTNTVECPAGQHLAYVLPDGSSVQLNAESTLKYHPLWWSFSRSLKFEGEAFFEVTKGSKFEVFSDMGTTAVLGTSFNIFSREDEYKVTCFTGKVKVSSPVTSEQVIITPDYKAEISKNGSITVSKEQKPSSDISWINNMFNFNAQPLSIVFKEIERQYNIQIQSNIALDYYYTGYFSKDKPVEEVLALVCKPFGLTFVRLSDNSYKIIQNQ